VRVLLSLVLLVLSLSFGSDIRVFKYCGHIEILGLEQGQMPFMLPVNIQGYVSPTGIDPQPPKSCAWVFLDRERGDVFIPTIVVWSDTFSGYHADIYSDKDYIFGHRQNQPSDYSPNGLLERNKEMENYLKNAAGERVLREVLRAIREGKGEATYEDVLDIPIPATPGFVPKVRVKYYLYDFEVNPEIPDYVKKLMEEGKNKKIPHTPDWKPITVPKELIKG